MPLKVAFVLGALFLPALATGAAPQSAPSHTPESRSSIALSTPFGAPPGWRLAVQQAAATADDTGDTEPGVIRLCLSRDAGRTCRPDLAGLLVVGGKPDLFSTPRFLEVARIVRPRVDLPLFLLRVASLQGGNSDQRVATVALRYDRARDTFVEVYRKQTRRNNNQEVRYVETGVLRGAILAAEPTGDAPFGFWIEVNTIGPGNRYHQRLRYRSATRYNDGNPLAVLDSEMPGLQRRLGVWRAGQALPVPAASCPRPRLIEQDLWCSAKPVAH